MNDWRTIELDVVGILIGGLVFAATATVLGTVILFVVGETLEHFTH